MSTTVPGLPRDWSLSDLQSHLGGVPLERIRLHPPPGLATMDDVARIEERENRLFELEDGVLVEKTVGWYESLVAGWLLTELNSFLRKHKLGKALGADGTLNILPGIVKIPDVSFISWARFPKQDLRREAIPALIPDLAVEILSRSNTRREMEAKLVKYFQAGVRLVWYIDPQRRTARVFTSLADCSELDETGVLEGGDVLPGFALALKELFDRADEDRPRETTPPQARAKQAAKAVKKKTRKTGRKNQGG